MSVVDLNSAPRDFAARTLPAEPSPHPLGTLISCDLICIFGMFSKLMVLTILEILLSLGAELPGVLGLYFGKCLFQRKFACAMLFPGSWPLSQRTENKGSCRSEKKAR